MRRRRARSAARASPRTGAREGALERQAEARRPAVVSDGASRAARARRARARPQQVAALRAWAPRASGWTAGGLASDGAGRAFARCGGSGTRAAAASGSGRRGAPAVPPARRAGATERAAASGVLAGAGRSASRGATIIGAASRPASSRGRRSSSCTMTVSVVAMTMVAATDSGTRHRDAQERRRFSSAACCSSDCGRVPTARRAAARMRSSSSGGGSSRGVSRYARSTFGSRKSGSVTSAPVRAGSRAASSGRTATGSSRSRD